MIETHPMRLIITTGQVVTHHQVYADSAAADAAYYTIVNAYVLLDRPCGGGQIERADLPTWYRAFSPTEGLCWWDMLRPGWSVPWHEDDVAPAPSADYVDALAVLSDQDLDVIEQHALEQRQHHREYFATVQQKTRTTRDLHRLREQWAARWLRFVDEQRASRLVTT